MTIQERRAKQRQAKAADYAANPDKYKTKAKKRYSAKAGEIYKSIYQRRLDLLGWFRDHLRQSKISCSCGESDLECLDFHHVANKDATISAAIKQKGWSKERLLSELDKCVVICSNCHRALHKPNPPSRKQRRWIWEYKSQFSCSCGENRPAALDFHHRDPASKIEAISVMVVIGYARSIIELEITKCDLLCSNCHRRYHASNRGPEGIATNAIPPTSSQKY